MELPLEAEQCSCMKNQFRESSRTARGFRVCSLSDAVHVCIPMFSKACEHLLLKDKRLKASLPQIFWVESEKKLHHEDPQVNLLDSLTKKAPPKYLLFDHLKPPLPAKDYPADKQTDDIDAVFTSVRHAQDLSPEGRGSILPTHLQTVLLRHQQSTAQPDLKDQKEPDTQQRRPEVILYKRVMRQVLLSLFFVNCIVRCCSKG